MALQKEALTLPVTVLTGSCACLEQRGGIAHSLTDPTGFTRALAVSAATQTRARLRGKRSVRLELGQPSLTGTFCLADWFK